MPACPSRNRETIIITTISFNQTSAITRVSLFLPPSWLAKDGKASNMYRIKCACESSEEKQLTRAIPQTQEATGQRFNGTSLLTVFLNRQLGTPLFYSICLTHNRSLYFYLIATADTHHQISLCRYLSKLSLFNIFMRLEGQEGVGGGRGRAREGVCEK